MSEREQFEAMVTPEMAKAGAQEYAMTHQRVQTAERSATDIYRAMQALAASPVPAGRVSAEQLQALMRTLHHADRPGDLWRSTTVGEKAVALKVLNAYLAAPSAPAQQDHPECSGDPTCCPENEGYGCCKPNHTMLNGLTESETLATASVAGLSAPAQQAEPSQDEFDDNTGLPCWHDISERRQNGETLTALETFIHDNEPAGIEDSGEFRHQLACLIAEVRAAAPAPSVSAPAQQASCRYFDDNGEVQTLPGHRWVAVNEAFDDLMRALLRAESRGYMPDAMADEWARFEWFDVAPAPSVEAPAQQAGLQCERCGMLPVEHDAAHWCDNQSFQVAATAPSVEAQADKPAPHYYVQCLDCCAWKRVVAGNHHPWCACGSDRFNWGDERKEKPE